MKQKLEPGHSSCRALNGAFTFPNVNQVSQGTIAQIIFKQSRFKYPVKEKTQANFVSISRCASVFEVTKTGDLFKAISCAFIFCPLLGRKSTEVDLEKSPNLEIDTAASLCRIKTPPPKKNKKRGLPAPRLKLILSFKIGCLKD